MRKLFAILFFCALATCSRAAYVTVSVTFTNALGPLTSNTFTRNATTVRYTNAPLNSSAWILTNNAARAATGLWNHLGANMPSWYVRMGNATNVLISGADVQFSIAHAGYPQFALLTTNTSGSGGTNFHPLMLSDDWTNPQKHQPYETNKTNDASSILRLAKLYALSEARLNFFSNEIYKATIIAGGIYSNMFGTNLLSVHSMNVAASNLTALAGQISGVNVTNAPWINSLSNRFDTVIVSGAAVITNLSAPGSGVSSFKVGAGSIASNDNTVAVGDSALAGAVGAIALGTFSQSRAQGAIAIGQSALIELSSAIAAISIGDSSSVNEEYGSALGYAAFVDIGHSNSTAIGSEAATTAANQVRLGTAARSVSIPGELQADGTTKIANTVRQSLSGPVIISSGTYSSLTGGSNNLVQLSTNEVTVISGHDSACSVASLRTGDGLPMVGPVGSTFGRRVVIYNGGSFPVTFVTASGFETQETNRFSLNANLVLNAGEFATFLYNVGESRWRKFTVSDVSATATNVSGSYVDFTGTSMSHSRGRLYYDTNCECLKFYNVENQIGMDVGQEHWIQVVNNTGLTITNGQTCYLNGQTSNGIPTAGLTLGSDFARSRFAGWATMNITNGFVGYITPLGKVNGISNPALTGGATNGSPLYLHPTIPGAVTNVITSITNGVIFRAGFIASTGAVGVVLSAPQPLVEVVAATTLDFPSTAAQASSDLPLLVTGCTSNSVVTGLGVPWMCATNGGGSGGQFAHFESNGVVFVRFANHTAAAINPVPGVFTLKLNPQF